jgi:hypothetical protein
MLLKARWIALPLCSFLICTALSTCEKRKSEQSSIPNQAAKKWNRERAELDYRLIQTELKLAKSEELYMVLNLPSKVLRLKLKGAVVWDYPIDISEADSQEVREFVKRFTGDDGRLTRLLSGKHLFSAQDKTPDSVLAIVGEAVKVDPELLQRDVPARFELLWGYGLILEIRTDIMGKPKSRLKNAIIKIQETLHRPFGEARIIVKMHPDDALTLYRATRPGLSTLLYPPL